MNFDSDSGWHRLAGKVSEQWLAIKRGLVLVTGPSSDQPTFDRLAYNDRRSDLAPAEAPPQLSGSSQS